MPTELASSDPALLRSVAVPRGFGEPLAAFLSLDGLLRFGARLGAWLGGIAGRPIRLGKTVLVARHADCTGMLGRDLDYRIGPVNGPSVDEVNGPFVLSIDRNAKLDSERRALYVAFKGVDFAALEAAAAAQADALLDAAGDGPVDAVAGYAGSSPAAPRKRCSASRRPTSCCSSRSRGRSSTIASSIRTSIAGSRPAPSPRRS